jgi:hypothetical protein
MPGLVPGIHVFLCFDAKDVDGRDKPGHDEDTVLRIHLRVKKLISLDRSNRFHPSTRSRAKISLAPSGKSVAQLRASRPIRGALRDRHGCWCGMRWTLWLHRTSEAQGGRQRRVVLISRRWDQVRKMMASDGGYQSPDTGESPL